MTARSRLEDGLDALEQLCQQFKMPTLANDLERSVARRPPARPRAPPRDGPPRSKAREVVEASRQVLSGGLCVVWLAHGPSCRCSLSPC